MKNDSVKRYYDILQKRKWSLFVKRFFDIVLSFFLLIVLLPVFLILSLAIKLDSPGPVLFRQERVTRYGKRFRIFKFRTMVNHAEELGTQITLDDDRRITRVGRFMRRFHLDETIQLLDVLRGTMTFVGTRPEVSLYVSQYTDEMMATLLLPAGITSLTSIMFRDEEKLMKDTKNADLDYAHQILPCKMKYNLYSVAHFTLRFELKTMFQTIWAVFYTNYKVQDVLEQEDDFENSRREAIV